MTSSALSKSRTPANDVVGKHSQVQPPDQKLLADDTEQRMHERNILTSDW